MGEGCLGRWDWDPFEETADSDLQSPQHPGCLTWQPYGLSKAKGHENHWKRTRILKVCGCEGLKSVSDCNKLIDEDTYRFPGAKQERKPDVFCIGQLRLL